MGAYTRGTAVFVSLLLLCMFATSVHAQTAQFLWEDSTTQGTWNSVYGIDGYNIIQSQQYPAYATVTLTGQSQYTWSSNTQDTRALQVPGQTYRVAEQFYSNSSFTIDINLTDGQTHEVAIYCLDWDRNARAQVVSVVNPANGAVLDSRTLNTYGNGQYLVWNLSGHVQIQSAHMAGYNATVSGIFFSPASTPTILGLSQQSGQVGTSITVFGYNFGTTGTLTFNGTTAIPTQWSNNAITAPVPTGATTGPVVVSTGGKQSNNNNILTVISGQTVQFLGKNAYTQGAWEGVYGGDGYNVIPLTTSYPSYATVTPSGQAAYTWSSNTSDVRGLQVPGQNYRIAAAWCDDNCAADGQPNSFTIGINLTDGKTHEIAVYCLDWDNQNRVETVSIINPQNGSVLDSQRVSSFSAGQYLLWNLSGNIEIQVTNVSGPNAVISGLFFSPSGTAIPTVWGVSQNDAQPGTPITVVGTNFGTTGSLTFNGTAATPTQWTNTSITAPVPSAATTGNVVVTAGTASNGVPFTVTPQITSINPTSGPIGTVVQINGTGFGSSQGSLAFIFNGVAQTPGLWTSTQVTSQIPDSLNATNVYISIGGSNPALFSLQNTGGVSGTVTNAANGQAVSGATVTLYLNGILQSTTTTASNGTYSFSNVTPGTYSLNVSATGFSAASIPTVPVNAGASSTENVSLSTPAIAALSPSSGPAGTVVTITGSGFGSLPNSSTVTFAGIAAATSQWSNTAIVATVPSGASTGSVIVTVGGAASNSSTFTVGVGTIQGTVTAGGTGVTGATVNALQLGVLKASATSGSGGAYSIGNLPPGKYDMEVIASGYGNQTASAISATAGTVTTQNFTIAAAGTISGTVTQSNGTTAISGATVNAMQGYTVVGTATTNSSGAYSIATLAAGTYSVVASTPGFDTSTKSGQAVTSGGTTTVNFALTTEATISYAYDEAGRLAAVVDSVNNAAVYNYDAAGNIVSITRKAASALTISEFVPNSGQVGNTVTIYGSGFSSTPSSDAVTFNGVATTVSSATPTSLVTTVPTGATTGKIKVTVGSASVTSSASFTVTTSNGLPTITSFTPAIASPGTTTVTINGTNFDTTASHDSLIVNVNRTYAATATSTALTTTIPGIVTTGHITVTTSLGSYTTSSYLFVPPSGYTVAQVGYTGQVALGGQVAAAPPANQIGLVAMDVPSGDGLSIGTNSTFASNVAYTIYDPYGNMIGSGNIGHGSSYIDTTRHTTTAGTCTILLSPGNQTSGSVTLSPTAISPDVHATISVGGSPVTVATTSPGQSAHITFSGYPGERIYLYVYNPTGTKDQYGNQGSNINLIDPAHNSLLSWGGGAPGSTWYGYSGLLTLSANGTYTINFTPNGLSTWGATFQVGSVPADLSVPITVSPAGGPPAPVTIATQSVAQSAHLTFSGSAGQRIYLYVYSPTGTKDQYGNQGSNITMQDLTTGSQLLGCCGWGGGAPGSTWYGYSGLITLASTGNYSINFSASGMSTWGATFSVVTIPADLTSNITVSPAGGPPSPVTIATQYAGQSAHLNFTGSAGQELYLYVYNPTGAKDQYGNQGSSITMIDTTTNRELLGCCGWGGGAPGSTWYGYSGLITLPSTGNYTINFSASGLSTWGATFSLVTIPPDVSGSITVSPAGGPPSPVTIATQYTGQSAHLNFTGSTGQQLYLYVYNPTGTKDQYGNQGSSITMIDTTTNRELLGCCGWGGGAPGSTWYGYSGLIKLASNGNYTINFTPSGLSTWGATFSLVTVPADVTSNITVSPAGGPPSPVTIATQYVGQSAHLNFTGSTGQQLYLYVYNPTGTKDQYGNQGSSITMIDTTTNRELLGCCGWGGGAPGTTWYGYSGLITLASNGGYTINFTPSGMSTWGATFSLVTIPAPASSSIGLNTPVTLATSYVGQSGVLTFNNTVQNQQVYLYITTPTGAKDQYGNQGSTINMLDPTSHAVINNFGGGNPGSTWTYCSSQLILSTLGNYTINFYPNQMSLWGATFELMTTPCP